MSGGILGFKERKSIWADYLEREVMAYINGNTTYGVLKEINLLEGYIDFQPSIVGHTHFLPDGRDVSDLKLVSDLPTRAELGNGIIMRPLEKGALDKLVETASKREFVKRTTGESAL